MLFVLFYPGGGYTTNIPKKDCLNNFVHVKSLQELTTILKPRQVYTVAMAPYQILQTIQLTLFQRVTKLHFLPLTIPLSRILMLHTSSGTAGN